MSNGGSLMTGHPSVGTSPGGSGSIGNTLTLTDASTNQAPDVFIVNHDSSATPLVGFGETIGMGLKKAATGLVVRAVNLMAKWAAVGAGTEESTFTIESIVNGVKATLAVFDWFAGSATSPRMMLGAGIETGIMRHDDTATGAMFVLAGGQFVMQMIATQIQPNVDIAMQATRMMGARAAPTAVATTITLPKTGNDFPLTVGTGTLNSINVNGMVAGTWFFLEIVNGITITHNVAGTGATILTSTGASIVSPAGGRLVACLYNGTNVLALA